MERERGGGGEGEKKGGGVNESEEGRREGVQGMIIRWENKEEYKGKRRGRRKEECRPRAARRRSVPKGPAQEEYRRADGGRGVA